MTPVPLGNFGGASWKNVLLDGGDAFSEFSGNKGGRHQQQQQYSYGYQQYENDQHSLLYDSKHSPSHSSGIGNLAF